MNLNSTKSFRLASSASASRLLIFACGLIAAVIIGGIVMRKPVAKSIEQSPSTVLSPDSTGDTGRTKSPQLVADTVNPASQSALPAAPKSSPLPALPGIIPRGEPSAESRQAIAALTQLDLSSGSITPVQAAVWRESLQALKAQGESGLPAIREFLEKNLDVNFSGIEGGALMETSSLRMALLKAMQEIGGEHAIAGSLEALQTSADPGELALVAAYLQKADPTQYRDAVMAAAHEALEMAAGSNWDGRDVAPLFDVLKTFGGEEAARDLEKYANTWFNYTPLVLAEMQDGAGIASLIRLNADGAVQLGRETYQRMLAQVSVQSPEAELALMDLAKRGKIDPNNWRAVADALAGDILRPVNSPVSGSGPQIQNQKSYHVAIGNQNMMEFPAPADMPTDQVNQRIQIIDRLLNLSGDSLAIQQLQNARARLAGRL
jgi:hypothetical protein